MIDEAVEAEMLFAADMLVRGRARPVGSPTPASTSQFVADQRLVRLGLPQRFGSKNPFGFMELQDVQELSNFFERTVSAYQIGVAGDVAFDEDF